MCCGALPTGGSSRPSDDASSFHSSDRYAKTTTAAVLVPPTYCDAATTIFGLLGIEVVVRFSEELVNRVKFPFGFVLSRALVSAIVFMKS